MYAVIKDHTVFSGFLEINCSLCHSNSVSFSLRTSQPCVCVHGYITVNVCFVNFIAILYVFIVFFVSYLCSFSTLTLLVRSFDL